MTPALHPTVAAALAAESPEQAIARDPGLQSFAGQSDEVVRSVARQRIQRGFALPPGVGGLQAPRAAAPATAAPAPRNRPLPKRIEPTAEQRAAELAVECRASETPLLDPDTRDAMQARFGLDFRSRSERREDEQRGARLDRLMGLAPAAEQGVHFDPITNVQTFGAPTPTATARAVRIGDEFPEPPRDVVQRLGVPVVDDTPRTRIGVRTEGVVQQFGVPVPVEPGSAPRAPRLSPAVLAAAAATDRRKVNGVWRDV